MGSAIRSGPEQPAVLTSHPKDDGVPFFSSLRWRITFAYAGVLAALFVVFVALIYVGTKRVLFTSAAERSAGAAHQISGQIATLKDSPFGPVSLRTALSDQSFLDEFAGSGLFVEAFNEYGKPIGKSNNLATSDLPTSGYEAWSPPFPTPGIEWGIATVKDARMLVSRQTFPSGRTPEATIYIGQSLVGMDGILHNFRNLLLTGLLIAFLFIILASISLARAALGPIGHITKAAREISGEQLGKRLNWKGRSDELGALGRTFDEMLSRLEHAFERERRFIADASHELKTPLTVINANSQMLTRWGARDEKVLREALVTIEAESATMARVINAMLTLAKTDNPSALTMEAVDVGDVVRDVGTALQASAQSKGLTLNVIAELGAYVHGERGLLRQLVINLVENAIKFTEAGSVTLALRPAADGVVLTVQDSGPGISGDSLPHIFNRFYRADPARSRTVEGTGLGLAVVENIVRVHGGRIEVTSQPGEGTTFTVRLPSDASLPPAQPAA
ncbi:MAG: sensor histidine kinase [Candidatus Eremiobacter antarcticus]|nr:HAMP domain-containing histidine kinase [Candidatus Eremiobacteraeota bacterium]MBC5808068.1 HAMP domain-containing histidine kinase [Candidatus Eremiobacteraeota bacterium]